ncbi:TlpA family protein disulfide reductase [Streptomyces silvisoli]|uniref:TlpA disulfide reductase family protein n=1 Tax=Streptomyces silvisoli TaxID=3034235 RepID=A0ABT5ZTI6_9ACTN|nr:TlpA disulfide reductase family protein [Streptomyces silvisoli]MDF3293142.1 TlpA disulfide reductase family protein [Streptomyces silvisoli]
MSLTRLPQSGPRRRAVAALVTGAALVLALAGCGSVSGGSSSGSSDTKFVQGTGQITTLSKGERPAAPDISGATVDGQQLSLSQFKGKVVVLNVWGSWCDPCRAEAPNLAEVAKDTAAKGVQFVGINIRDYSTAQSKSFEHSFGITYPSFYDPDGNLLVKFPRGSLPPQSIPTTLIIDRDQKIAVRALTALTTDQLRKALDPIVAEK